MRPTRNIFNLATIVLIFSLVSAFITYNRCSNSSEGYKLIWLLPLSYGILFYSTNSRNVFPKYFGFSILNLILFVRYLINPVFSAYKGLYFHSYALKTQGDVNTTAILLMIYEMICIFLTLHYVIKRLDNEQFKVKYSNIGYDSNYGIYIIVIVIGTLSFVFIPSIHKLANFFVAKEFAFSNLNAISSVAYLFTFNTLSVLFVLILSNEFLRSISGHRIRKFLILLVTFINIAVFFGNSRLTVLAQGIASIALLNELKLTSKKALNIIFILTIIIVLSLSSYRYFNSGELRTFYDESGEFFTDQLIEDNLQAYFGGPHLISIAINAKEEARFSFKPEIFFNEIVSSIYFVRQLFPPSNKSATVIFNHKFGYTKGNSMIIPTLGQSYMYFGLLGAPFLSFIFCLFLYKAEKALIRSRTIGEKYAFYLLVVWLAFFPMQNLNIVMQTICNVFLPFYFIVKTNQKLNNKRSYFSSSAMNENS